jgi:signal transduction histidine kinase
MATKTAKPEGAGWLIFSALMLSLVGLLDLVNGLWALHSQDRPVDTLFFNNNIEAWGWFYVIVGTLVFLAGLSVYSRKQWAVSIGMLAAIFGAIANLFWIFQYPIVALLLVLLNVMVLYGLTVYGSDSEATYFNE